MSKVETSGENSTILETLYSSSPSHQGGLPYIWENVGVNDSGWEWMGVDGIIIITILCSMGLEVAGTWTQPLAVTW